MPPTVPHLNSRALAVFLLLALPPLAIGVALVLAVGHDRLGSSYGHHLEQLAQQTAAGVDTYVYRRTLDVSLLARSPELRREAAAASARPFDRAAVDALDKESQQTPTPKAITAMLDNAASRYLADLVAHDRIYRELLLTDSMGRLVAASGLPSDYYQADEDWWTAARGDGRRGQVSLSDVRWDPSARVQAIEIAVPVPAPDSDTLVGILKAVTDSREMLALVRSVQLGDTGSASLLRRDGSIVYDRGAAANSNARFWAADAVQSKMHSERQAGSIGGTYFEASTGDGTPYLVGLADSQLASSYPNVSWVIAVSQARDELLAPMNIVGWYLLVLVAAAAIVVLALALWFSIRLAAPQVDIDMHLVPHPPVAHVGELSSKELPGDRVAT
jgi:hypothetical protein